MSDEGKLKAKPGTTCADCRFFEVTFDATGQCYANPPTVLITAQYENHRKGGMDGGDEETVRPTVSSTDRACTFHEPEEERDPVLHRLLADVDNSLSAVPIPTMVAMKREKWQRLFNYIKTGETE